MLKKELSMQKIRAITFSACIAVCAMAIADESSKVKAHIQQEMNKYVAAMKRGDVNGCASVIRANFAPDCKFIGMDGKVTTRDKWIASMNGEMKWLKFQTISLTCTSASVKGNTGMMAGKMHFVATFRDQKDKKKMHKLEVTATEEGTLTKKNGRWWVTTHREVSNTALVDGKAMKSMR